MDSTPEKVLESKKNDILWASDLKEVRIRRELKEFEFYADRPNLYNWVLFWIFGLIFFCLGSILPSNSVLGDKKNNFTIVTFRGCSLALVERHFFLKPSLELQVIKVEEYWVLPCCELTKAPSVRKIFVKDPRISSEVEHHCAKRKFPTRFGRSGSPGVKTNT